jgi:hypothetical protein
MKTESAHALALLFEVDRATMLRALKTTPADGGESTSRPTWKVSTASNALAAHRASIGRVDHRHNGNGSGNYNGNADITFQDPVLMQLFAQLDEANASLRALPALDARRRAAVAMVPLIARVDMATRQRGKLNGLDGDGVNLRADALYALQLRGLEGPCDWTTAETWAAMSEKAEA